MDDGVACKIHHIVYHFQLPPYEKPSFWFVIQEPQISKMCVKSFQYAVASDSVKRTQIRRIFFHVKSNDHVKQPLLYQDREGKTCVDTKGNDLLHQGVRNNHPTTSYSRCYDFGKTPEVYNPFVVVRQFYIRGWRRPVITEVMIRVVFDQWNIVFSQYFKYLSPAFDCCCITAQISNGPVPCLGGIGRDGGEIGYLRELLKF